MSHSVIVKFRPESSKEFRDRFVSLLVTNDERETMGSVFQGFVFQSDCSPRDFLAEVEDEGFDLMDDFKSIEFRAY